MSRSANELKLLYDGQKRSPLKLERGSDEAKLLKRSVHPLDELLELFVSRVRVHATA